MSITSARDVKMYGCTKEEIEAGLKSALDIGYDHAMYVGSILSDAQECNGTDLSRQLMNKAKYILFTYMRTPR